MRTGHVRIVLLAAAVTCFAVVGAFRAGARESSAPVVGVAVARSVTKKFLLATSVVGMHYLQLLDVCLQSLMKSLEETSSECELLIITTREFSANVEELLKRSSYRGRVMGCTETVPFLLRYHVYEFANISLFEAVLQFDVDTIFNGPLDQLLSEISPGKFFAFPEGRHDHLFWSLERYPPSVLQSFTSEGVQSFNSGILAFQNSPVMLAHLRALAFWASLEVNLKVKHFTDQSFANVYMNTKRLSDTRGPISDKYVVIWAKPDVEIKGQVIFHFIADGVGIVHKKLEMMTQFLKKLRQTARDGNPEKTTHLVSSTRPTAPPSAPLTAPFLGAHSAERRYSPTQAAGTLDSPRAGFFTVIPHLKGKPCELEAYRERFVSINHAMRLIGVNFTVFSVGSCTMNVSGLASLLVVQVNSTELLQEFNFSTAAISLMQSGRLIAAHLADVYRAVLMYKFQLCYSDSDMVFISKSRRDYLEVNWVALHFWEREHVDVELVNSAFCLDRITLDIYISLLKKRLESGGFSFYGEAASKILSHVKGSVKEAPSDDN
jgi:hypothetical protein